MEERISMVHGSGGAGAAGNAGRRRGRTAQDGGAAEAAAAAEACGIRIVRHGKRDGGEAGGAEGELFPGLHSVVFLKCLMLGAGAQYSRESRR